MAIIVRAAKIVILDKDNNALILRRSNTHPRVPLHPDIPGGIIEKDETFEAGLLREVQEETGLIFAHESIKLVYTLTHDWFSKSVTRLLYAVRLEESKPDINVSWEHADFSWQPIKTVKSIEKPYQEGIDYATKHDLWSEV